MASQKLGLTDIFNLSEGSSDDDGEIPILASSSNSRKNGEGSMQFNTNDYSRTRSIGNMMKEHSYDNSLNPDLADNSFQKKLSSMF
jgi:hypothetical protein